MNDSERRGCVICAAPTSQRCGGCKTVRYCSVEHQRIHWNTSHKERCANPQPSDYEPATPVCDHCHDRPWGYVSRTQPNDGSTISATCINCGAVYCGVCSMGKLFRDTSACAYCSVPCPMCEQPIGDVMIMPLDEKITQMKALLDQISEQHKNRGLWCMILGELFKDQKHDPNSALPYFKIAGQAGFNEAYTNIGNFYFELQDYKNAQAFFELAATSTRTKPDGLAAFNLGILYLEEWRGVGEEDFKTALKWFVDAADMGHRFACSKIGGMHLRGSQVIPQDKKLAVKWYRRGAEGGDRDCMYRLARRYRDGEGVKRDLQLSRKWYQCAAEKGCPDSMHHMGQFYSNGWGVERDLELAREWWQRAADEGIPESRESLEMMDRYGFPVITHLPGLSPW